MLADNFWLLLAGLALFLYGMFHLEDAIKEFEGRGFKLFLRKYTKKKLSAVLSGTLVTGVLQSSSVVNLMLLSLVGAGTLTMRNALAVILGSNIGGTFNSWLVAWLGFKADLNEITLPIIGISGIGLILTRNRKKFYRFFRIFMGLGLLLFGLELIKSSMKPLLEGFDFTPYLNYPRIVFVIIGFVITGLVQTSAATVAIVLSALDAGLLPLETAVAVVLGAELGTTVKILIGSIAGGSSKKRLAYGNIIFNVITSAFGFILLVPLIHFLQNLGLKDPLIVMVAFQTFINIAGALLFFLALDPFGNFLEKHFQTKERSATVFISQLNTGHPDIVIDLFEKETELFIRRAIRLNMEVFGIEENGESHDKKDQKAFSPALTYSEKYHLLKQSEGELLESYYRITLENIQKPTLERMSRLLSSARNAMYSAKGMKDISHNSREFSNSANDSKYTMYQLLHSQLQEFYRKINSILSLEKKDPAAELLELLNTLRVDYDKRLNSAYKDLMMKNLKKIDVSTFFNIHRELYSSSVSIILSLRDYLLSPEEAEKFENSNGEH